MLERTAERMPERTTERTTERMPGRMPERTQVRKPASDPAPWRRMNRKNGQTARPTRKRMLEQTLAPIQARKLASGKAHP
jgi:hypothetical protein